MKYIFEPRFDITTYELAYVVAHMAGMGSSISLGMVITDEQWKGIPDNVQRHFRKAE